jgi:arylsulfatase A-like enzyme
MWDRLLRSRWTYVTAAVLLLLAAFASQIRIQPAPRSPGDLSDLRGLRDRDDVNVVFVLVDTLRADHLHAYGYERETSPFLDEMARNGIRFGQVRAQSSWTKTSVASLLTSTYPIRNGVLKYSHAVPQDLKVAAEIFKEAGFRTGGIYRNGWVAPNFGFGRGFDFYLKPAVGERKDPIDSHSPGKSPLGGTDLDITESALEFFKDHQKERFFLYLHLMDVHQYLYEGQSARFGTQYVDAYDNAIHWMDRNISALYKGLNDLGLLKRTLVVLVSDHGEGFYEHGREGHGTTLYAEVTRTPWIISPPFNLKGGVVVEPQVENVDVFPTLLDLLGLPPLPQAQGVSRVAQIESAIEGVKGGQGAPAKGRDSAYLNTYWGRTDSPQRPIASIGRDGFRLILDICTDQAELFDLGADPMEQRNLAKDQPEKVAELRAVLEQELADDRASQAAVAEVAVDALRLEQLRALGYVVKPGDNRPEFGQAYHSDVPCVRSEAAAPLPAPAGH